MIDNDSYIQDLYRKAFDGASVDPPDSLWSSLEKSIDDGAVEKLYKEKFEDDRVAPPIGLWFKIQQSLWLKEFLRFNPTKINVYYSAVVALVAGIGLYYFNKPNKDEVIENQNVRVENTAIYKTDNSVKSNTQLSVTKEKKQVETFDTKSNTEVNTQESNAKLTPKTQSTVSPIATQIKSTGLGTISLFGDSTVCRMSTHIYSLECSKAEISTQWKLSPQNGVIEKLSDSKIGIFWEKVGSCTLTAEITCGNQKASTQIVIDVIDAEIPKILGNTKICQGSPQQFRINNAQDLNKMYTWEVTKNKITVLSNGFISFDPRVVGYDTIKVVDVNTLTGCIMTSKLPVVVYPRPDADFTVKQQSNGEVIFSNSSTCGQKSTDCKFVCNWTIDDVNYKGEDVKVSFTETGAYIATLDIQNDFKCKSSERKEIQISVFNLFVPNAFYPGVNNFKPTGENLLSYKIEIFNSMNKKLWESDQLVDGKPFESWDGQSEGAIQPKGTYIWKISATFKDGTKWMGVENKGQYKTTGTFYLLEQ